MADDIQAIFAEAGYTYPGTPEAGAKLLLSILGDAQEAARSERTKYAELVTEITDALNHSPLHETPGDPVKHIALLCERLQREGVASITNVVATLRRRHPELSKRHPGDDHDFLADLDDLTDPKLGARLLPLVQASAAYRQALLRGEEHVKLVAAFTLWSQLVDRYLDDEGLADKEDPLGFG